MTPVRLVFAVVMLALGGIGAGVVVHTLTRPDTMSPENMKLVPVTIEALRLTIPAAYLRTGTSSRGEQMERVDLVAEFPDMNPLSVLSARRSDPSQAQARIFVAIMRSDGVLDPAERPDVLYGRFLEPDVWDNPGGLMMRRFAADSPYGDEELFLAPPDGRRFSARCRKPVKATEDIGEACLWRLRVSGADLQVRFSPDLLTQWDVLESGIQRLLSGWTR